MGEKKHNPEQVNVVCWKLGTLPSYSSGESTCRFLAKQLQIMVITDSLELKKDFALMPIGAFKSQAPGPFNCGRTTSPDNDADGFPCWAICTFL